MIRRLTSADGKFLAQLGINYLPHPVNLITGAAVDNVAYGFLETFAEATFIVDHTSPTKSRVIALKELIAAMEIAAKNHNIMDIYAFVEDPKFADIMKSHFSFETCKGEPLIRKILHG